MLEENAPQARPMCGSIVGQFRKVAIIFSGLCRFAIVAERGAHPAHLDRYDRTLADLLLLRASARASAPTKDQSSSRKR